MKNCLRKGPKSREVTGPYARREALLSTQIGVSQSWLTDLLLFDLTKAPGVPFDGVVKVSSYGAGMESSHSTSAMPRTSQAMVCSLAC